MARPAQYSQGRRLVMQVTMFVVLLGTVGLAGLLAQSRARGLAVTLTDKPHLSEALAVRYPKGWTVQQDAPVQIIEPKRRTDSEPRLIVVHQMPVPPSATAEQLFRSNFRHELGEGVRLQTFPILGQQGAAANVDHYEQVSDFEVNVTPRWSAAAVVPGARPDGQHLGVILEVRGPAVSGPAGLRLLRQLADGLSLRRKPGVEQ